MRGVTNIVIAGLGGQGVITASDIVADVALQAGFDVKKSELHGMSQRGGSVASDVRFGREVFSPMVPAGEADFLVAVEPDQVSVNAAVLSPSGIIVEPPQQEKPERRITGRAKPPSGVFRRGLDCGNKAPVTGKAD
jgi:indolepyruvate ferredoxin oxidoreductase beta subunit